MTAKSWLFSQEKLQLLIYLVSWFGLLAGHELLFQLQLFVYSVGHISLYDELQPTDSWRRLTADACFALCTARGAWQMGNCSAECRDGHGICSLCEWHFRMQFLPVCQSTICPPPRYPIRIRVLDICCFITLVKCIQFNAPFFLHSAILGLARKRHANECNSHQLLHLLPSSSVSNVEQAGNVIAWLSSWITFRAFLLGSAAIIRFQF